LAQGLVLGTYIRGFEVAERSFAGGMFDWLTPFSLLTGAALVSGYALLGATWLVMKTTGPLQDRCFTLARRLLVAVLVFVGMVSIWTPLMDQQIAARWFSWPNIAYLSPVPIVTAAIAWWHWRSLQRGREVLPFVLTMVLFLLSFLGLGISLWPNVIPPGISICAAAAPPRTQAFALIGTLILLPVVLGYTAVTYYVFRGKVRAGEGYH
jgi:cytochrome d ubiquinol oxidase subunit II